MAVGTLLIRADASVRIGTGHVMRCLALAQAWQDVGGRAVFAMAESLPAIDERLSSEGMQVVHVSQAAGSGDDERQTTELARLQNADWVVLDGYRFEAEYQQRIKSAGKRLLVVDDLGEVRHYFADLVLNQNVHGEDAMYEKREPLTRLLTGARFVLLRREFTELQERAREIPPIGRKVLITMGGSDPENITAMVISACGLVDVKGLEVTVLVGGGNPHLAELKELATKIGCEIRIVSNPQSVIEYMQRADVAVAAAGATCWEMCFLGLPAILIVTAENQRLGAQELGRQEIAVHMGMAKEVTEENIAAELQSLLVSRSRRDVMSRAGRRLVDGRGVERVLTAMRSVELRLRRAGRDDCRLLWEWANDPEVRAASFQTGMIPWEEHATWFAGKLDHSLIYIAESPEGLPVGQCRIDKLGDGEAQVDVSVAREKRGSGIAAALILRAAQAAFCETELMRLHAYVKAENRASLRAFEKAGFTVAETSGNVVHYSNERGRELSVQASR